ncbi:arginine repressor [Allosphingosinicella flava]|uniref:Arginine repressor n=1 Tax=Allosphingosinicella flava TaxID=2771430 RepID=A0A7T2LMB9_9SPHN|nr:arginine repressor [Sphingosinicella flava]QPQ54892.1 arginine repressor [Sphingosinicella flava]
MNAVASGGTARARRLRIIADIIAGEAVASQEEVTERLAAMGLTVTQATVSRDLDHLGAVKVRQGGTMRYALPGGAPAEPTPGRLERIFAEWVLSVEAAGTLLILKTPPGSAHIVGHALDQAQPAEIAGTLAGDDTLFVALRDGVDPGIMADRLRAMAG